MFRKVVVVMFAVVVSMSAVNAHATLSPYQNDVPTDPCGAIDPDVACYAVTSSTTCKKGTGYDACNAYCICMYNANVKKCGSNVSCKDLALTEKNACLGNCIADWSLYGSKL